MNNILETIDPIIGKPYKDITTEEWFNHNVFAIDVFNRKYRINEDETPPKAIWRVCKYIAEAEGTKKQAEYWASRWFNEIVNDWWYPAGSIIQGAGNEEYKMSFMNCAGIEIEEDSLESIAEARYIVSKMAAYRQGVGINFSKLRPRGFKIANSSKESLGVTHWMRSFDRIGQEVGQAGRIPALLISLSSDHMDIEEFIDLKTTSLDMIRNANISVQITDGFMRAAVKKEPHQISFTTHHETRTLTIYPHKLIRKIAESMCKMGEPGIQFIDLARKYSNTDPLGFPIVTSNACQPRYAPVCKKDGICELGDVFIGDEIWSEDGWVKVVARQMTGFKPVYKVITENSVFIGTLDHNVLCFGNKIDVGLASHIDYLNLPPEHNRYSKLRDHSSLKIIAKYPIGVEKVYRIQVDGPHHTYWSGGCNVCNCSELLLDNHNVCLLSSINAGKFAGNLDMLDTISESLTRFLDDVITMEIQDNRSVTKKQREKVIQLRRIGCGVTNLAEYLFNLGYTYNSKEGIKAVEKLFREYTKNVYKWAQELGKTRGRFPAFRDDLFSESKFIQNMKKMFGFEFKTMRFATCIAIAPTGSITTQFRNCAMSYGIEPPFGLYYWKRTRTRDRWDYYFVVPQAVKDHMESIGHPLDMESTTIRDDFEGTKGKPIKDLIDKYCKIDIATMYDVSIEEKMELLSKVYKYVDSSIAVTNNMREVSPDRVEKLIYDAYNKGIKSFTCYPEGSRLGIVELIPFKERAIELAKSGIRLSRLDMNPEELEELGIYEQVEKPVVQVIKRPKELNARVHKTTVKGEPYYIFIGFYEKSPYEVFLFKGNQVDIPTKNEFGKVIKIAKGRYKYVSEDFEIANITDFQTGLEVLTTRLVSMALRHRVPIKYIIEQLSKSRESIVDFCSGLLRILRKYESKDGTTKRCPVCGKESFIRQEGCMVCLNCGHGGICE